MKLSRLVVPLAVVLLAGCQYSWKPSVPEAMRTVSVPVFRNRTSVQELGSKVTTQILREFQREGTFAVMPREQAALEIQGEVCDLSGGLVAYNSGTGERVREQRLRVGVRVSVIDHLNGKVLINDRDYVGETTTMLMNDVLNARQAASGRIAEDVARQVVDDVLMIKFNEEEGDE